MAHKAPIAYLLLYTSTVTLAGEAAEAGATATGALSLTHTISGSATGTASATGAATHVSSDALTLAEIITGILDRLNASTDEFWLNARFLDYAQDFLRRTDVREACWHEAEEKTQVALYGQRAYVLPTDFWRPNLVYWVVDDEEVELARGTMGVRGNYGHKYAEPRWLIREGRLWLEPAPTSDQSGRQLNIYYIRKPTLPTATTAPLDMPHDLGEALAAYLMARALEKGGPEMQRQANSYMQQAVYLIREAAAARDRNRGDVGFVVTARW